MKSLKLARQFACIAVSVVGVGLVVNQAQATTRYFDTNGVGTGSGVTAAGSYSWESPFWNNNDSVGTAGSGAAWTDGDFPRFAAGTDAGVLNYTVTAGAVHTFNGIQIGANGGGTVTINTTGGGALNSGSGLQGVFVATNGVLKINAALGGVDATSALQWSGGGGSLNLYGANTFQGGVSLNSVNGLNFNNDKSFGTGPISWNVATQVVATPDATVPINIGNTMTTRAASTLIMATFAQPVTWSGGWTLPTTGTATLDIRSGIDTTISGVISGTNVAGGFIKGGSTGTGQLTLTNANTYLGPTTAGNGTLVVSNVGNSGANSNLGKNGTVNLGLTTTTGTLKYTGAGETSDKVLNLGGTTGGGTIDQSGTGLLKFTSNMTATGVGIKTLTLQGATAGTGEIAGKIVDNGGANTTAVAKAGAGTWTLSNANTYTGGTTVSAGILNVGNNSALGGGPLTLGGGTIAASGAARTIANNTIISTGNGTVGGANDFTFGGTFTNSGSGRTLTVSNTGLTTFGTVDLSEATGTGRLLTITGGGNTTFGGVIENFSGGGGTAGSLTFNTGYSGIATLNGANTYSGTTTLSTGGTFVLGNKAAFGTSTVAINGVSVSANTDLNGANKIANATVNLGGNNTFTGSKQIEFSGTVTETASRTVTNNMTANLTFSGPVNLSSNANDNTLLVTGTGNTLLSGVIANGGTSTSSSLSKSGGGILTLTGANTYGKTGVTSTTVSAGRLLVDNTSGSGTGPGNVLVNGGILGGGGHIDGSVSVTSGSLSPGASINVLDIGGNLSMSGGSFDYEINSTASTADLNTVVGNLSLASVALSGSELGAGMLAMTTKFTLINYGGTWDGGTFTGYANHSTNLVIGANRFQIDYDDTTGGTNLGGGTYGGGIGPHFVTITAVPEASAFLTIGLGGIFAIAAVWMSKRLGVSVLKS